MELAEQHPEGVPSLRGAIAAEVRGLMGRHRVSQKRLAAYLTAQGFHMSQPALSKRLAGRVPWTVDELEAVAKFFDKSLAELLPTIRWSVDFPGQTLARQLELEFPPVVERSLAAPAAA